VGGAAGAFFVFFCFVVDAFGLLAATVAACGPWSWKGSFGAKFGRRSSLPLVEGGVASGGAVGGVVAETGVPDTVVVGVVAAAAWATGDWDWWSLLSVWYAKKTATSSTGAIASSIFFSLAAFARAASCALLEAMS
jgi:hypothetical protein